MLTGTLSIKPNQIISLGWMRYLSQNGPCNAIINHYSCDKLLSIYLKKTWFFLETPTSQGKISAPNDVDYFSHFTMQVSSLALTVTPGKLGRSDTKIGKSYSAKLWQFRSKFATTHAIAIKWKENTLQW